MKLSESCLKRCLSALLTAGILTAPALSAAEPGTNVSAGVVDTVYSPLNVRSEPSLAADKLTKLESGSFMTLLGRENGWYRVQYAEVGYGWCAAEYINETVYPQGWADVYTYLNVRESPDVSARTVSKLVRGEGFIILNTVAAEGWMKILYDGTAVGYVASDYVREGIYYGASAMSYYSPVSLDVVSWKQYDARWASRTLGGTRYTVRVSGCTLCSFAMSESWRRGVTYTPLDALSERSFTSSGAMYWPSNYKKYYDGDYLAKAYELLAAGTPVLIEAKKSSGTTHWVLITGYTGGDTLEASGFEINDPGSSTRTTLADYFGDYLYYSKLVYYS